MKRILSLSLCLALTLLAFSACGEGVSYSGKKIVYASFSTLGDFAEKIGGDKVEIVTIMPHNADPHDWEPTPKNMSGLENANMFIYNGAGIEAWVDSVLSSLNTDNIILVKTSEKVPLLSTAEEEDHYQLDPEDDHDHDNETEEEHAAHDHGEFDPHTWLSPHNAITEMEAILDGLILLDPENQQYYSDNFTALREQCLELDSRFHALLSPHVGTDIVVAHGAYGYLLGEYGLHQLAVKGYSPDSEPSPKKMVEVIDYIRENHISCIYFETNGSPDIAEAIARDTGAKAFTLNPLETVNYKNGEDYFSIMEYNLSALSKAFE